MKLPLDDNQIYDVKDEYALVMDIWHEIERLAIKFTSECARTQEENKRTVEEMNAKYASQLERMSNDNSKELQDMESHRRGLLSAAENTYEMRRRDINKKKDKAKKEHQKELEKADTLREDTLRQIRRRSETLNKYLESIDQAEIHIVARRYKRIAHEGTQLNEMNVNNMDQIMGINPEYIANEINVLNEKMLQKLIRPSVLRKKCVEFYTLKCKAKELYVKEMQEHDATVPKTEQKISYMISEADKRLNKALQECSSEETRVGQEYSQHTIEIENKYKSDKNNAIARHAQLKSDFLTIHERDKNKQEEKRRNALTKSLQDYQADHLYNLPPKVLKSFVDSIVSRKVNGARNFHTADKEPYNVSIGYMYFRFEHFLGNKLVNNFMSTNYGFILKNGAFVFPYTIAIDQSFAYCFKYSNKFGEIAKQNMQTMCLNTFLATPPNKMRFTFIDPLKSGQSFALFKHFEEENSSSYNIIMGGIQTESSSIEQQLQVVVDHIKTMQVNTFKGQYTNIRDYNKNNELNPQPYNILGIMDFPAGFTPKAVDLLSQVVATGKACGVYVILMENEEQMLNVDNKIIGTVRNIENMCKVYQYADPGYVYIDEGVVKSDNIRYMIDKPIDMQEIVNIAPIMRQGIKDAGRIVIDYGHIAPKSNTFLTYNTNEGISIPIGMSGASDIQKLNLGMPGSQSVHALICGQIGSGKSRLLHAIITGALLQYPKEELELYLVDFKSGTEFKIYADYNLPNFKVIAIESEQEFGLSVLQSLKAEADRRAQMFNDYTVSDITSYNNGPGKQNGEKLPRVLIVIDEFHMMFSSSNTSIAKEASQIMDGILRLDRSFGFHMVLCSQSIRGMNAIDEAALAQIAVRIALKCPKEDADIVLGKGSDAIQQIEENDAGSAIYLPAISSPKVNNKFRVGYLSPEQHTRVLQMLDSHYTSKNSRTNARVLVSDISDSRNSLFQKYVADGEILASDRIVHIGEPLKVDAKMEVRFDPMNSNNMLLMGKNAQKAHNILFFILYDLLLQRINQQRAGRKTSNITVINYSDGSNANINDKMQDLAINYVDYYDGSSAMVGLSQVYDSFEKKSLSDPDEWLIISNMALANDLQGGSIYGSNREHALKFEKLLKEGPSKGVFVIAWCDDPALYRSKFASTIEYFGKRVVFNVSDEDATTYADVIKDESINKNNAYIFQNGKGKEKFRVYSTPTKKWFELLVNRLEKE